MKKITIWDMDFYHKKTFVPNPVAMKISSYHKQKGNLVNFVSEEFHIDMSFDEYYIIKERVATPRPPGKLIHDRRVRLIGRPLRFFENHWEPTPIVSAVRPDYMLYPESEEDAYYNANIAQFYHNGRLLRKKQPFENAVTHHKKTLVIDREFWRASEEDISFCLKELKEHKSVAFLHPIDVKKILKSEKLTRLFIELDYSPGTIFRFRNTYGSSFEEAQVIFDFLEELRENHNRVRFGNMPIRAVTSDHWQSRKNALFDLERNLKIMDLAKQKKVHIRIVSPADRFESPYWYYFESLEFWSLRMHDMSYVEMMLHSATRRAKLPWMAILNDSRKWFTPNTNFLLSLMTKTDFVHKYGFRQWGEAFLDEKIVDWNEIKKYEGGEPLDKKMEE